MYRQIAVIALGAALLTACGGPTAPTGPTQAEKTAVYLAAEHNRYPGMVGETPNDTANNDAAAVSVGRSVCDAYAAGTTFDGEVSYLMAAMPNMTAGDAGFLIGNATSTFCPQYNGRH
jgi:hypothetical protein